MPVENLNDCELKSNNYYVRRILSKVFLNVNK